MSKEEEAPARVTRGALRRMSVDQEPSSTPGTPKNSTSSKKLAVLDAIQEGSTGSSEAEEDSTARSTKGKKDTSLVANKSVEKVMEQEVKKPHRTHVTSLTEDSDGKLLESSLEIRRTPRRRPSQDTPQKAVTVGRRTTRRNSTTSDDGNLPATTPKVSNSRLSVAPPTIAEDDEKEDKVNNSSSTDPAVAEAELSDLDIRKLRNRSISNSPVPRGSPSGKNSSMGSHKGDEGEASLSKGEKAKEEGDSTPSSPVKEAKVKVEKLTGSDSVIEILSEGEEQTPSKCAPVGSVGSAKRQLKDVKFGESTPDQLNRSADPKTSVPVSGEKRRKLSEKESADADKSLKSASEVIVIDETIVESPQETKQKVATPKTATPKTPSSTKSSGTPKKTDQSLDKSIDASLANIVEDIHENINQADLSMSILGTPKPTGMKKSHFSHLRKDSSSTPIAAKHLGSDIKEKPAMLNEEKAQESPASKSWSQAVKGTSNDKGIDAFSVRKQEEEQRQEEKAKQLNESLKKKSLEKKGKSPNKVDVDDVDEEEEDEDDDVSFSQQSESQERNSLIDDEAMEANDYESGDSLDSDVRAEMEDNEVTDGESIGSEDTDGVVVEEDEDDDSFISSEGEELDLLDGTGDDLDSEEEQDKSKAKKKHKRIIHQEDSSEDETETAEEQPKNTPKKTSSDNSKSNSLHSSKTDSDQTKSPKKTPGSQENPSESLDASSSTGHLKSPKKTSAKTAVQEASASPKTPKNTPKASTKSKTPAKDEVSQAKSSESLVASSSADHLKSPKKTPAKSAVPEVSASSKSPKNTPKATTDSKTPQMTPAKDEVSQKKSSESLVASSSADHLKSPKKTSAKSADPEVSASSKSPKNTPKATTDSKTPQMTPAKDEVSLKKSSEGLDTSSSADHLKSPKKTPAKSADPEVSALSKTPKKTPSKSSLEAETADKSGTAKSRKSLPAPALISADSHSSPAKKSKRNTVNVLADGDEEPTEEDTDQSAMEETIKSPNLVTNPAALAQAKKNKSLSPGASSEAATKQEKRASLPSKLPVDKEIGSPLKKKTGKVAIKDDVIPEETGAQESAALETAGKSGAAKSRKSLPAPALISADFYSSSTKKSKRNTINVLAGGDEKPTEDDMDQSAMEGTTKSLNLVTNPAALAKAKKNKSLSPGASSVAATKQEKRASLPSKLPVDKEIGSPLKKKTSKVAIKDDVIPEENEAQESVALEEESPKKPVVAKKKPKDLSEFDTETILSRCNEIVRTDKEKRKQSATLKQKKKDEKRRQREEDKQEESGEANESMEQQKKKKKKKKKPVNYLLEELGETKEDYVAKALQRKMAILEAKRDRKKAKKAAKLQQQLNKENQQEGEKKEGIGAKFEKKVKKEKKTNKEQKTAVEEEPKPVVKRAVSAFAIYSAQIDELKKEQAEKKKPKIKQLKEKNQQPSAVEEVQAALQVKSETKPKKKDKQTKHESAPFEPVPPTDKKHTEGKQKEVAFEKANKPEHQKKKDDKPESNESGESLPKKKKHEQVNTVPLESLVSLDDILAKLRMSLTDPVTKVVKKQKLSQNKSSAVTVAESTPPRKTTTSKLKALSRLELGFHEEPLTPEHKVLKRNHGFKEEPATPRTIGFKVSNILPAGQEALQQQAVFAKKRKTYSNSNRIRPEDVKEPVKGLPQPIWTRSGSFEVEEVSDKKLKKSKTVKATESAYVPLNVNGDHSSTEFLVKPLGSKKKENVPKAHRFDLATVDQRVVNFKAQAIFGKNAHLREKKAKY